MEGKFCEHSVTIMRTVLCGRVVLRVRVERECGCPVLTATCRSLLEQDSVNQTKPPNEARSFRACRIAWRAPGTTPLTSRTNLLFQLQLRFKQIPQLRLLQMLWLTTARAPFRPATFNFHLLGRGEVLRISLSSTLLRLHRLRTFGLVAFASQAKGAAGGVDSRVAGA